MDSLVSVIIFGPFLVAISLFGVGIALLAWRFVVKVWDGAFLQVNDSNFD
jgi:hypothetical protein